MPPKKPPNLKASLRVAQMTRRRGAFAVIANSTCLAGSAAPCRMTPASAPWFRHLP